VLAPPNAPEPPLGAYGLVLPDLRAAAALLVEAPPTWTPWRLSVEVLPPAALEQRTPALETVRHDRAQLRLAGGGWVDVIRDEARSTLYLDKHPEVSALAHPYLSLTAAVAAFWRGDLAFHGAAAADGGGAWGFVGAKGAGKSTTLAALRDAGARVVTDDVLVIADGDALAGPRSIDLRSDAGSRSPDAVAMGLVGARDRWRLAAGDAPAALPFRGFFLLRWGDALDHRPVEGARKVERLLGNMSLRVPPRDPAALRRVLDLPMWELSRPQRADAVPETVERILELMAR
jgi:hypothetical protein